MALEQVGEVAMGMAIKRSMTDPWLCESHVQWEVGQMHCSLIDESCLGTFPLARRYLADLLYPKFPIST